MVVGRDRNRDPAVVPTVFVGTRNPVEVLRRRSRSAVSTTGKERSIGGVLDRLLGGDVECGIDHRGFDEPAFARPPAMLEREHQAEQRVESSVGITDAVRLKREKIGMPGE